MLAAIHLGRRDANVAVLLCERIINKRHNIYLEELRRNENGRIYYDERHIFAERHFSYFGWSEKHSSSGVATGSCCAIELAVNWTLNFLFVYTSSKLLLLLLYCAPASTKKQKVATRMPMSSFCQCRSELSPKNFLSWHEQKEKKKWIQVVTTAMTTTVSHQRERGNSPALECTGALDLFFWRGASHKTRRSWKYSVAG